MELLAVITLIALISMISFPVIRSLINNNNNKQFTTYEDLMVEYAKTLPINKYKDSGHICLSELKMKAINEGTKCNGYVKVDEDNKLKSYLICVQNGDIVYQTEEFTIPDDCKIGD